MPDPLANRLLDARDACRSVEEFAKGQSFDTYLVNQMLRFAIERGLEIIGEALNYAEDYDAHLQDRILELRAVIGLCNRIIHGYSEIDHQIVWIVATQRVPELRIQIESVLATLDDASAID